MLKYVQGDLFSSPAKVLVNTVNTQGVMGKGIALTFKQAYPEMFKKYQEFCEKNLLSIGKLWLYKSPNKWVLNFPTKKEWRKKSEYQYIEEGLKKFVATYQEKGITSIAFPKLGCGNGGLDWDKVKQMMEQYLGQLPIEIYIYEKELEVEKEYQNKAQIKTWLNSNVQDLPFSEFKEDLYQVIPQEERGKLAQIDDQDLLSFWHILKENDFITIEENPFSSNELYDFVSTHALNISYIKKCYMKKGNASFLEALQIFPPISAGKGDEASL